MVGNLYTQDEVLGILMNLVNGIGLYARSDNMPKRYKQMMFNEMLDKDPKLRKRIESVLKSHKTKKES